jgi:ubiquinone/menaquinone biosynthesis C-methylase UbiE
MTTTKYDPNWVRDHYDAYGMKEWHRWERTPSSRIAFAVHAHYLRQYLQPGQRILEIGTGAGRFTQLLAEIGARITVADISPGQLALNRQQAEALGFAAAVEAWVECDACELHEHFSDGQFDTVVGSDNYWRLCKLNWG